MRISKHKGWCRQRQNQIYSSTLMFRITAIRDAKHWIGFFGFFGIVAKITVFGSIEHKT